MYKLELEGPSGNAFYIMAYVMHAMREQKYTEEQIDSYLERARLSDYNNLVAVSLNQIETCNLLAEKEFDEAHC